LRMKYKTSGKNASVKEHLLKTYGNKCVYCGKRLPPESLYIEHVAPQSEQGSHEIYNLRLACEHCNCSKGSLNLLGFEHKLQKQELELKQKLTFVRRSLSNVSHLFDEMYGGIDDAE